MNDPSQPPQPEMSREEFLSALFANLVIQQTNMAHIFLGHAPHPETGEVVRDLETARYFIDLLEMLAEKTKGNLDVREEGLMKQSLTGLRMAFVQAVDQEAGRPTPAAPRSAADSGAGPAASGAQPKPPASEPAPEPAPSAASAPHVEKEAEEDSRKKFSKKY
jgi:hypothetical protein